MVKRSTTGKTRSLKHEAKLSSKLVRTLMDVFEICGVLDSLGR